MLFVYNAWEKFCSLLKEQNIISIPAKEVSKDTDKFLVLKHDVENAVLKAYQIAEIENKYGHRGTYYVQAYLLNDLKNIELLQKMQTMGHEISYHYDVMDSNHGDLEKAISEFDINLKKFEKFGFQVITVCQHGNPVIERIGYTSNRDFFRSNQVQAMYPNIADIMVDYKKKYSIDYSYFSDAGRKINFIFDPINNDIVNSDMKNVTYKDLDDLLDDLPTRSVLSIHPHRWARNYLSYVLKEAFFKIIKTTAKLAMKNTKIKRFMSRYYYLAKRI